MKKRLSTQITKAVCLYGSTNAHGIDLNQIFLSQTADTLVIIIGKHHSREQIEINAIIEGDDKTSMLLISGFSYRRKKECQKQKEYYEVRLSDKIEKKFVSKVK